MIQFILLLSRYQRWIFLALAIVGVIQLMLWWRARWQAQFTVFGIEREALAANRARAVWVIFILLTMYGAVFLSNAFIAPNLTELFGVPPTATPATGPTAQPTLTPTPPLVLPGFETPTPDIEVLPTDTLTPVPAGGSGCLNPRATITSPIPGAILAGEVKVRGTADIDNFAFYVVEISTLGENWLTVITDVTPVNNDVLGKWDTRLQNPGEFALRLVVYDSAGAHPDPCTIPITIALPAPTPTP